LVSDILRTGKSLAFFYSEVNPFFACRTQLRRFRVYNLVGWGLPLTLTLILQYITSTHTAHVYIITHVNPIFPCRTQLRRFRVYNLVGWGLPLTLTLITLILQYIPSTYTAHLITPGIGKEIITNCFKSK
jgi:hypothetical protein